MNTCSYVVIIISGLWLLLASCTYRTGEETPNPGCMNPNPVSYVNDVVPIVSANCYVCHDQVARSGGIAFDTYAGLKVIVDNGRLEGAINHTPGFEAMPQNQSKLSDCTLELIQSWIDAGAPEN